MTIFKIPDAYVQVWLYPGVLIDSCIVPNAHPIAYEQQQKVKVRACVNKSCCLLDVDIPST